MSPDNYTGLNALLKIMGFRPLFPVPDDQEEMPELLVLQELYELADDRKMLVTFQFYRASDTNDYHWLQFEASLSGFDPPRKQIFYLVGPVTSRKQAFNLLDGRSAYVLFHHEQEPARYAWIDLDFSTVGPDGNFHIREYSFEEGYNLEKMLEDWSIEGWEIPFDRRTIIFSLQCGNIHSVICQRGGRRVKVFISASPALQGIHEYKEWQEHFWG